MAAREVIVLGTSSAVPTRTRNHVGLLLRVDGPHRSVGVLVDPGEGTQRQLLHAGVPASAVDVVWLTHVHGDHCLGLPGFLQRRGVDGLPGPVHLVHPAEGDRAVNGLLAAHGGTRDPPVVRHRLTTDGEVLRLGSWALSAVALDHRIAAFGLRLQEDDGLRVLHEAAQRYGVTGHAVGRLLREGSLTVDGRVVRREDIAARRPGQSAAVVMDTRLCAGAAELALDCDLLVTEATFLAGHGEEEIARDFRHLTARQAGALAREGGARRLVLQHYSQRHPREEEFAEEARAEVDPAVTDVVAALDLQRVPFPPRR